MAGLNAPASEREYSAEIERLKRTLRETNDALNSLPKTLKSATDLLNKNMMFVSKDLRDNFVKAGILGRAAGMKSQFAQELSDLAEEFNDVEKALKDIKNAEDSASKSILEEQLQRKKDQLQSAIETRKNMTVTQQLNKKLIKDLHDIGVKTLKDMFSSVVNYAKRLLDTAYETSLSTMKSTYNTLTAYNSYDAAQWQGIVDSIQESITKMGLDKAININDVMENTASSLKEGLQGTVAEMNAMYASIAQKAGITFDWMNSDWVQMIGQMAAKGDDYVSVMEHQITSAKALTKYYGDSLGLAQGRINQINTLTSSLGVEFGFDADAVNKLSSSMMVMSQEFGKYGIDATSIFETFKTSMEQGLKGGNVEALFGLRGITGDELKARIASGNIDELVKGYMETVKQFYTGGPVELSSSIRESLGSGFSETDIQKLRNYFTSNADFATNYDAAMAAVDSENIEDITDNLSNYVDKESQYQNTITNKLSDIAEVVTQSPLLGVVGRSLMSGASNLLGTLGGNLFNQLLSRISGSGSSGMPNISALWKGTTTLKSGVSSWNPETGWATINGQRGKLGARWSESDIFGTSGGLKSKLVSAFTTQGKTGLSSVLSSTGAKVLGGAGGAVMMLQDAVSGYQSGGARGAIKGALTGVTGEVKSGWGVLGAAAKNAAKGAMLGTMFGGPFGTAIGGVAGAALGAAGALDALAEYNKPINVLKRNTEAANKAIQDSAKAAEKLNKAQKDYTNTVELAKKAKEGDTSALNTLTAKNSDYAFMLSGLEEGSDDYKKVLEQIVEIEKRKLDKAQGKALISGYSGVKASDIKESRGLIGEGVKALSISTGIEAAKSKTGEIKELKTNLGEHPTEENIKEALKQLGIETTNFNSKDIWQTAQKIGLVDKDTVAAEFGPVGDVDAWYKEIVDTKKEFVKNASSYWNLFNKNGIPGKFSTFIEYPSFEAYTNVYGENIGEEKLGDALARVFENWNYLGDLWNEYGEAGQKAFKTVSGGTTFEELKNSFGKGATPKALWKQWAGVENSEFVDEVSSKFKPKYAAGTNFVPVDNYIALLHRGEQVRTAAEVAVDRAEKHVASSDAISTINSTLLTQTTSIIQILTDIYNRINVSLPGVKGKDPVYDLPPT